MISFVRADYRDVRRVTDYQPAASVSGVRRIVRATRQERGFCISALVCVLHVESAEHEARAGRRPGVSRASGGEGGSCSV